MQNYNEPLPYSSCSITVGLYDHVHAFVCDKNGVLATVLNEAIRLNIEMCIKTSWAL